MCKRKPYDRTKVKMALEDEVEQTLLWEEYEEEDYEDDEEYDDEEMETQTPKPYKRAK